MVAAVQKMTWKEFREMEVDDNAPFIYELINGMLLKRTSCSLVHQDVSRRIEKMLDTFLEANPLGKYYHAPVDVYLDKNNGVVPDISFVVKDRFFLLENNDYIASTPDLIIEIISPGRVKRDRVEKKELYKRFAVKEFWLVDPLNRTVEVYVMNEDAYQLHGMEEGEGKITSTVLTGFVLEVKDVF